MAVMTEEQQVFLEGLVKDMTLLLHTYAWQSFPDKESVEDIVNDTLLIACQKIDVLEQSPNPEGWLMQTLKYVILNRKKQRRRQEIQIDMDGEVETVPAPQRYADKDMDIAGAQILGAEDYAMFRRFTLKEITGQEAAEEWGCSLDAANKRLQRMRKKLQEAFKKDLSRMS